MFYSELLYDEEFKDNIERLNELPLSRIEDFVEIGEVYLIENGRITDYCYEHKE